MAQNDEILAASEEICSALNSVFNKNPRPMSSVWLLSHGVTAMRPNCRSEVGLDAIWIA